MVGYPAFVLVSILALGKRQRPPCQTSTCGDDLYGKGVPGDDGVCAAQGKAGAARQPTTPDAPRLDDCYPRHCERVKKVCGTDGSCAAEVGKQSPRARS